MCLQAHPLPVRNILKRKRQKGIKTMFFHTYQNYEIMERLQGRPDAAANVFGSPEYPSIRGTVAFYQLSDKVLVQANFIGLPDQVQLSEEGKPLRWKYFGIPYTCGQ